MSEPDQTFMPFLELSPNSKQLFISDPHRAFSEFTASIDAEISVLESQKSRIRPPALFLSSKQLSKALRVSLSDFRQNSMELSKAELTASSGKDFSKLEELKQRNAQISEFFEEAVRCMNWNQLEQSVS